MLSCCLIHKMSWCFISNCHIVHLLVLLGNIFVIFFFYFLIFTIHFPAVSMANGVSFFTWLSSSQNLMSPDLVRKLAQTSSTQTFNSKGLILLDLVSRATLCQKGPLILDPSRTISRFFLLNWVNIIKNVTGGHHALWVSWMNEL